MQQTGFISGQLLDTLHMDGGISISSGGFVHFALPTLMDVVYLYKSGTIAHMSGGAITPSFPQQTMRFFFFTE